MFILSTLGITSELFFILSVILLIKRVGNFRFRKLTLSYLGTLNGRFSYFNVMLIAYAAMRTVYYCHIIISYRLQENLLLMLISAAAMAATFLIGIFPADIYPKIHGVSGWLVFVFTGFVVLLTSVAINVRVGAIGTAMLLTAVSIFAGTWYLYKKFGVNAIFEIWFVVWITIWDILMTISLLRTI